MPANQLNAAAAPPVATPPEFPGQACLATRFRGFLPVVVDVETGGFDPQASALLEVAMQPVTMDGQGYFHPDTMLSACIRPFPGSRLSPENLEFLHLDPYHPSRQLLDERDALLPMFREIRRAVSRAHCHRAVLVGHNSSFDLGFINAAAARLGAENKNPFHPFTSLDTASLCALVYGQTVLARACQCAGVDYDPDQAHRAVYDTAVECRIFCALLNRYTAFAGLPAPLPATP